MAGERSSASRPRTNEAEEPLLRDDEEAVAYRNAALVEDDPEVLLIALRDIARSRKGGLTAPAEAAHLNRERL